jgi:Arc-like DNA binding domain
MSKLPDRAEMVVRVPMDVKQWIEREAAKNCASRNGEIVRILRAKMDSEQPTKAAG